MYEQKTKEHGGDGAEFIQKVQKTGKKEEAYTL